MWRLVLVLALLLTGCSSGEPNREIAEKAIALQTRQLQQQLQQNVSKFDISQVNITQKQPLSIDKLAGYRIGGTYDFTISLPKQRLSKHKNPFDLYLQRQKEGKTWRLALPKVAKNGFFTWLTYAID
ncbi:MAG: hypothetical protein KME01_07495 [Chroococcus sp. CMT-3BRIN-NPC107]|jgi:hypothetical protein|nr:hypothetical protein [Chroococcus sp. CMT-3BRIN-NPC107]